MKKLLSLFAVLFAVSGFNAVAVNVNWRIGQNAFVYPEDTDTITLAYNIGSTVPNGIYDVYAQWTIGAGASGSPHVDSEFLMAKITVGGTSPKTWSLNSGSGSLLIGVNEMNGLNPTGSGPTSGLPNTPTSSPPHFTGAAVLNITRIIFETTGGAVAGAAGQSNSLTYDCAFLPAGVNAYTATAYFQTFTINVNSPARLPEPLNLIGSNPGLKSSIMILYDPSGNIVVNFGMGPKQTGLTDVYQPNATGPFGTYTAGYGIADNGNVGTYTQKVSVTTMTLTQTSTNPSYSAVWSSDPNPIPINVPISGIGPQVGPGASSSISGGAGAGVVVNNSSSSHTLQWSDATGATVGTTTTIAAGASAAVDTSTLPAQPVGTTGTYTLKDTTTGQVIGTVTTANIGDGMGTTYTGNVNATINNPAGTQTPVATSSNTGNAPSGVTTPSSTPTTTVNNAATTISGTGAGATNQDLYNDIKTGVADAAGSPSTAMATVPTDSLSDPSIGLSRGHLDDIQADVTNAVTATGQIQSGLISAGDFSTPLNGIPTSLGSVTSVSYGSFTLNGAVHTINADLTPFLGIIGTCRAGMLFICNILFFFKCAGLLFGGAA